MKIRNLLVAILAMSGNDSICSGTTTTAEEGKPYSNLIGLSRRR